MAKDSYNIDDILSELKEHKDNQNKKVNVAKKEQAKVDTNKSSISKQPIKQKSLDEIKFEEPKEVEAVSLYDIIKNQEAKAQQNAPLPISKDIKNLEFDDVPNTTKKPDDDVLNFKDAPATKADDKVDSLKYDDALSEEKSDNSSEMSFDESATDEAAQPDNSELSVTEDEATENTADSLTDIQKRAKEDVMKSRPSVEQKTKKGKNNSVDKSEDGLSKPRFRDTKKGKIIISVLCVLLALIIATVGCGYWYLNKKLDKVAKKDNKVQAVVSGFTDMDVLKESFEPIYEASASDVYSYKDMVEKWFKNGKPCSSTHVLNILLIGEDTEDDSDSRADSAIICSVNIDTKTITFTSVLRDLYTYFTAKEEGQFGKINAASSIGGISDYINAVEKNYKIEIDNYATVNFDTFPKIIDKLGGLTIEMTRAEVNEINNNPVRYLSPDKFNVDESEYKNFDEERQVHTASVKCNGLQALAYSRIRKIDSDNMRANRQKTVLLKIMEKAKNASTAETLSLASTMMDYVKTGYSKSDIVSIGKYALNNKWLGYKTQTYTVPTEECSLGGTYYACWCWKADIPKDAYNLQMKIYGKSNVKLAENRPDFKTLSNY